MNTSVYDILNNNIYNLVRSEAGFTMRIAKGLITIDELEYNNFNNRHSILLEYFNGVINVYKEIVKLPPYLLKALFGDCPRNLNFDFHRALGNELITPPVFFRTDESSPGRILEIQCPGSQWGEYQVVVDFLFEKNSEMLREYSLSDKFSEHLCRYLHAEEPVVHHLLDNSSIPHTMNYFIQKTRNKIKYFSLDKKIKQLDCNFIRSHSVYGLVAENFFWHRVEQGKKSKLFFDLPPFIPFDEKISLSLPFNNDTKQFFSDNVRSILAYTTPILTNEIQLENSEKINFENFSKMSRSTRNYYLKYAGSDVSINWGSRAVYRLSNCNSEDCLTYLTNALRDFTVFGRCWILQKEEKCYHEISWIKTDNSIITETLPTGFRGFYGPFGLLGIGALHRSHYKIHGQEDTIFSIVSK